MWENVLDWEHLPWLHATTFGSIEHEASGPWGWRARVHPPGSDPGEGSLLELRVDRESGSYVVATLAGAGRGVRIETRLSELAQHTTQVEVEFLGQGVAPSHAPALGRGYVQLYARLWDEDEGMMRRRSEFLALAHHPRAPDAGGEATGSEESVLGTLDDLRTRLPLRVRLRGREFRIVERNGELLAHATLCPHAYGPLDAVELEGDRLRCPWHGYRFDIRTRRCIEHPNLRLARAPRVVVDSSSGVVHLDADGA